MFGLNIKNDCIPEGIWADEIKDLELRRSVSEQYQRTHGHTQTPLSHPWLFDPLSPPQGWRYDPYYELWIKL